ncbi:MAG: hypothetical protein U0174_04320 [Polyangiaceae bacterium]
MRTTTSMRAAIAALGLSAGTLSMGLSGCGPKQAASALEVKTTWCPEHYEQGPGDTCFALPAQKKDAKILLYFPGAEDPLGAKLEFAVLSSASAKGYAVVLAHGKRGACGFTHDVKDGNCWPDDDKEMSSLTEGWEQALWQVTALLEGESHPRYVVAFREGADFATKLSSKGMLVYGAETPNALRVDGVALVGLPSNSSVAQLGKQVPLAVLDEEASQSVSLKEELARAKWIHARCNRSTPALSSADFETATSVLVEMTPPPPPPPPRPKKGQKKSDPPPVRKPDPPKAIHTVGCVLE